MNECSPSVGDHHRGLLVGLATALETCAQALKHLADMPTSPAENARPVPFLPIKLFCQQYPLYTESALRSLVFYRATNGLHAAVVQIERKLLIDVAAFFRWVEQHKQSGLPNAGVILPAGPRRPRQRTQRLAGSSGQSHP